MEYSVRLCPICGKRIQMGHNLSKRNFDSHVKACPSQVSRTYLSDLRRSVRQSHKQGIGSTVVAGPGQFGFPFIGIPHEVTE